MNGLFDQATPLITVLLSWIVSPSGATLSLLSMGFGAVAGLLRLLGKGARLIMWLMGACLTLLVLFVLGGLLEAWGVPVRATLETVFAFLPRLINDFGMFLHRMFEVALNGYNS
ncbi:hypothetical protein GCM10007377_15560 [Galliscardovia ingluviei]|uniref:Uncharacterized protein n=1 Tax=Galliscardovia ingluviei TaxID=1769422 RepID=A0A8J3AK73_9BIFI|nr:hypothetical protein [Galliscardovia ingluviei]GGI15370.1 hypothetical protein GCM10007377_15560 [Galliscardovia ingluviei]